ncbi:hypothetical protein LCGC14_1345750 [marine sediment metagenome]|uniref:Uncharacterized protein n=1 Tax=marine sediment metagenome TaxID=412755 RepID=A0A0F9KD11_9ZZZZ
MGKKKVKVTKTSRKAVKEAKPTSSSAFQVGSCAKGHTVVNASQMAEGLGIDAKRLRAWLRSENGVGNDKRYTRYQIDLDSKEGKSLTKRANVQFA